MNKAFIKWLQEKYEQERDLAEACANAMNYHEAHEHLIQSELIDDILDKAWEYME